MQESKYKCDFFTRLGKGSFGTIFKGYPKGSTLNPIAVKRIENDLENDYGGKLSKNAKQEFDALKIISANHKNIVDLLDFRFDKHFFYMIMEFCNFGDLKAYLEKKKPRMNQKVNIMLECASAIAYLHGLDPPIVHRDIKPGNILITHTETGDTAKISDFGMAKVGFDQSFMSTEPGALEFRAPELFGGSKMQYTESIDIFALGLVFEILLKYDGESCNSFLPGDVPGAPHLYYGQSLLMSKTHGIPEPRLFQNARRDISEITIGLVIEMVSYETDLRPPMQTVLDRLEGIQEITKLSGNHMQRVLERQSFDEDDQGASVSTDKTIDIDNEGDIDYEGESYFPGIELPPAIHKFREKKFSNQRRKINEIEFPSQKSSCYSLNNENLQMLLDFLNFQSETTTNRSKYNVYREKSDMSESKHQKPKEIYFSDNENESRKKKCALEDKIGSRNQTSRKEYSSDDKIGSRNQTSREEYSSDDKIGSRNQTSREEYSSDDKIGSRNQTSREEYSSDDKIGSRNQTSREEYSSDDKIGSRNQTSREEYSSDDKIGSRNQTSREEYSSDDKIGSRNQTSREEYSSDDKIGSRNQTSREEYSSDDKIGSRNQTSREEYSSDGKIGSRNQTSREEYSSDDKIGSRNQTSREEYSSDDKNESRNKKSKGKYSSDDENQSKIQKSKEKSSSNDENESRKEKSQEKYSSDNENEPRKKKVDGKCASEDENEPKKQKSKEKSSSNESRKKKSKEKYSSDDENEPKKQKSKEKSSSNESRKKKSKEKYSSDDENEPKKQKSKEKSSSNESRKKKSQEKYSSDNENESRKKKCDGKYASDNESENMTSNVKKDSGRSGRRFSGDEDEFEVTYVIMKHNSNQKKSSFCNLL